MLDTVAASKGQTSAGILEQSVGARNPVGIRLSHPARLATYAGGIDSLESIPGLLKSLKYRLCCSLRCPKSELAENKSKAVSDYR